MRRIWTSRALAVTLLTALAVAASPGAAGAQGAGGQGDPRLGRARDLITETLQRQRDGRYREAVVSAREALALREAALGKDHLDVAAAANLLAAVLEQSGQYAESRAAYERALQIREKKLGPNHVAVAGSLNGLGIVAYVTGDYAAARPLLERALRIREQARGPSHVEVAETLNLLGLVAYAEGIYAAARPLLERSLQMREALLGPGDPLVAQSVTNMGRLYRESGDYAAAQPLLERGLQMRERAYPPTHPTVAFSLSQLALLRQLQGDYLGARPLYERSLRIREQALGPDHPEVANSLADLASLLHATGDDAGARPLAERALAIREKAFGTAGPVAGSLSQLGTIAYASGDYATAQALLEKSLALREARLGPAHRDVAVSLTNLAMLRHAMGDYAGARPLYERAIAIYEQALGPDHAQLASPLAHLGRLLRQTGDVKGARPVLERSLAIRERALGPDHPEVAYTLDNLGHVFALMGDTSGARTLYVRALAIKERALGPNNVSVASTLWVLGLLAERTGDLDQARALQERGLRIREQTLGPGHIDVAASLHVLGLIDRKARDFAGASQHYERALPIVRSTAHPELRWRVTYGLALSYERLGRPTDALPLYRESVAAVEGLAAQFADDSQRAQFLQVDNKLACYDALARLLLKLHEGDSSKGYDREAWAVLEQRKGRLVADALTAARPVVADPRARRDAKKVESAQRAAAALEHALREEETKAPGERQPETIRSLTTQLARTKAEYLAQVQDFLARYPRYRTQFVDQQTVDPKALAKFADRLPPGTVAIQYFAAPDALYLFVVSPGGHFQVKRRVVRQDDLYALVRAYRAQVAWASRERLPWTDDGSEAYRRAVAPLRETTARLSAILLAPIEAELATHANLILIPNDLLLYLPIHALTRKAADGSTRFLAETHAVSYVTQLELVDLFTATREAPDAPLLAVANPDGTLPAASREVRELARLRPAVTALEGADATKARFLGLVPKFPDIHMATHGVLDAERPERSYLLMAGADEASQRLTVGEIAGLSLSPNTLAILSGCETALGEQVPGAALVTLAAAFSQAGSQTIVASLWEVNDAATRDFMVAFHRARAAGRVGALQRAQLAVLGKPATAHPYYWAPFILIGAR